MSMHTYLIFFGHVQGNIIVLRVLPIAVLGVCVIFIFWQYSVGLLIKIKLDFLRCINIEVVLVAFYSHTDKQIS